MLFLIDENLPRSVGEIFVARGWTVVVIVDTSELHGKSDEVLFDYAVAHDAIIVTRDLNFANPLRFPLEKLSGMILIRFANDVSIAFLREEMKRMLHGLDEKFFHQLIIVEPGTVRTRRLV